LAHKEFAHIGQHQTRNSALLNSDARLTQPAATMVRMRFRIGRWSLRYLPFPVPPKQQPDEHYPAECYPGTLGRPHYCQRRIGR
jgi:hypothetical protein